MMTLYAFSISSLLITCTFLAGSRDNLLKYELGQEKNSPREKFDPVTGPHLVAHKLDIKEFEHEGYFSPPKLHDAYCVRHQQFSKTLEGTHVSQQWSGNTATEYESSHLDCMCIYAMSVALQLHAITCLFFFS